MWRKRRRGRRRGERGRERGREGRRKGMINETRGSIKRKYTFSLMSLVHPFSIIYLAISQGTHRHGDGILPELGGCTIER